MGKEIKLLETLYTPEKSQHSWACTHLDELDGVDGADSVEIVGEVAQNVILHHAVATL